jgi:hypothetical protein
MKLGGGNGVLLSGKFHRIVFLRAIIFSFEAVLHLIFFVQF